MNGARTHSTNTANQASSSWNDKIEKKRIFSRLRRSRIPSNHIHSGYV